VTINSRHFDLHRKRLESLTSKGLIFGVGVSVLDKFPEWDYENMVSHIIVGVNGPKLLMQAEKRHKVLLLGYKTFGRGAHFASRLDTMIAENKAMWYRALPSVLRQHHVSFDNLAIEQLNPKRCLAPDVYEQHYMGHEGQFSMYIDAVEQQYALCSYAQERKGWHQSTLEEMFAAV